MKKFIIDFFREFPACTGLLSLLIALHLIGVKDLRTPIMAMQEGLLPVFYLYCCVILIFMLFILPKIEKQKRKKITWLVVVSSVIVSTVIAKILV